MFGVNNSCHLLRFYFVPGTVLSALYILHNLIITTPFEAGTVTIISALCMTKLKHRLKLSQGYVHG